MAKQVTKKRPRDIYFNYTQDDVKRVLVQKRLRPIAFRNPEPGEPFLNSWLELCTCQTTYKWEGDDPRIILERRK